MKKFVVAGGPHSGKSSIISELNRQGEAVLRESARAVMECYEIMGIDPRNSLNLFEKDILKRQMLYERLQNTENRIFIDSGLPEIVAYKRARGEGIPSRLYEICKNNNYDGVFVCLQLPDFKSEGRLETNQSFAEKISEKILEIYKELGFEEGKNLWVLSGKSSLEQRTERILEVVTYDKI